jgi:hypothetical protein
MNKLFFTFSTFQTRFAVNHSISRIFYCFSIYLLVAFFISGESFGQFYKTNDKIGGSGSSSESSESNDNTAMYVAAGLVIGGLIAYALLRDKPEEEPESDTSSVGSNFIDEKILSGLTESENDFIQAENELPVNLIFGMHEGTQAIREKTYLVGLAVRF